ncbi:hypothetical protein ASPCADRAFT_156 [Aspergillus carbonarius ITEM 5010]|uniref:Uncharacterized protein n=1 Tax=Aspergillus carbonarius (strain ITEM 5010) TaxID=602072 RepID=A0A1R3S0Z3_ASPC5|nr:hypothetical protein ASPCADRAFT_156 [Aspergillus carbonarius ITEM 5010]
MCRSASNCVHKGNTRETTASNKLAPRSRDRDIVTNKHHSDIIFFTITIVPRGDAATSKALLICLTLGEANSEPATLRQAIHAQCSRSGPAHVRFHLVKRQKLFSITLA